jgi:hypothetical protein
VEGCTLREVCAQALDFPCQVTSEMLLEEVSCLGVRVEVALERGHLPPDDACGLAPALHPHPVFCVPCIP